MTAKPATLPSPAASFFRRAATATARGTDSIAVGGRAADGVAWAPRAAVVRPKNLSGSAAMAKRFASADRKARAAAAATGSSS